MKLGTWPHPGRLTGTVLPFQIAGPSKMACVHVCCREVQEGGWELVIPGKTPAPENQTLEQPLGYQLT